jgi:glucose-1-phosphate thymidylyltransferase
MNALLLAAGYATRLYPLTLHAPKPLLPVAGKPIAQYLVEQLAEIPAVRRLLVVTNHRFAGHFQEWASRAPSRFAIEVVDDQTETNETRLGAIGDVSYVLAQHPELGDEPLLVLGGDNLLDRQRGEPDDATVMPGRSVSLGIRAKF